MAISVNHSRIEFTIATSSTVSISATATAKDEGWMKMLYWTMPAMSANVSGDMILYDNLGHQLWAGASDTMSSASTSAMTGVELPVESGYIFKITLNAVPGSAAGVSATPATGYLDLFLVP